MSLLSTSPNPRYIQVAEQLKARIVCGELVAGSRMPSFAEMRGQGISQNTLEKSYDLLAAEGLVESRHRLGVFVAQPARRPARHGILGVVGQGFTFQEYSPYWVEVLKGIRQVAAEVGMQVLLLDFCSNAGWEKSDGVLMCDWSDSDSRRYLPSALPCVSLLVPAPDLVSVSADDFMGGELATRHLLELGHTRIAMLHSNDQTVSRRRLAGYRNALNEAGIMPREAWARLLRGPLDYGARFAHSGKQIMTAWLAEDWDALGLTAIITQNDETALGVIDALQCVGYRVPHDVSVMGYDGTESATRAVPPLTSIQVPLCEIAVCATRRLVQMIRAEEMPEQYKLSGAENLMLPVRLQCGKTTSQPPVRKTNPSNLERIQTS